MKFRRTKPRSEWTLRLTTMVAATIGTGLLSIAPAVAWSRLQSVKVSSRDVIPASRWILEPGGSAKAPAGVRALAEMKRGFLERDFKTCLAAAGKARTEKSELKPWIAVIELECAIRANSDGKSANGKGAAGLASAAAHAEADKTWLAFGPHASRLRENLIAARLALVELDIGQNRTRAADGIAKLETLQTWMTTRDRATLWRLAGELSFLQQRLEDAREFYGRSQTLVSSEDIRSKLTLIERTLSGRVGIVEEKAAPAPTPQSTADLEASPEELELANRMTSNLKSGDIVPSVEDGIKIILGYPGGTRAKWAADRILEVYLSVADKADSKFILLREKILKEMERADADRISEWARVAYNRGFYDDALRLSRIALMGIETSARSTKIWSLVAESALNVEKFDLAREAYVTLATQHTGTPNAREALLRVGLLDYRQKKYSDAITSLEKLLVLPAIENQEVIARHWLWRALQKKGDAVRARQEAEALIARFPFSYYGLRARAELANGQLEWPREPEAAVETRVLLTAYERKSWDRAQALLAAGWFEEAQAEIRELPLPQKPEEKALRARLWAAAFNYPLAVKLVNEAWDTNRDLRRQPFIDVAFPREFTSLIEAQATARKLEPALVTSLIKQESSFYPRATSTSQALGLMQLIPPTAREVAVDLKIGDIAVPDDLFNPSQNIRMGSYYLAKLLRKYSGHVPLALASYNAGPGKVDKWLKVRPSLAGLAQSRTSNPDDELWIDELPWDETSFYVKAILRNLMLYRLLDKGRVEIKNPVWGDVAPATGTRNP